MGLVRILIAAAATAIAPSLGGSQIPDTPAQVHGLRSEHASYFETSFVGSITCHVPQHYSFRKFYDLNLRPKDGGAKPFPQKLIDYRNSDDTYSVFVIHERRGLYFRYFGYRFVSNEVACF